MIREYYSAVVGSMRVLTSLILSAGKPPGSDNESSRWNDTNMPEHLYIFVNGVVFDASNGVQEFMNRGEIADLVGIARASAVVLHLPFFWGEIEEVSAAVIELAIHEES